MASEKSYKFYLSPIRERFTNMTLRRKCFFKYFISLIVTVCALILMHNFKIIYIPPCFLPMKAVSMFVAPLRAQKNSCESSKTNFRLAIKDSENHYITHLHSTGRLGNQMFLTASTFGIAHTLKYKVYVEPSHPLLPYFEIKPSEYLKLENTLTLDDRDCRTAEWECRKNLFSYNLTVHGLLQSWKYFKDIFPVIREIFTIKPQYLLVAKNFLTSNIREIRSGTVVGVHVRRTDFLRPDLQLCGYTVATVYYLKKAMDFYKKQYDKPFFVFLSDDINWCKRNIISNDVIFSDFKDAVIDLAIMTLCDHVIMTGGTFGWWGAWLAGGQVVYLKDWPWPGSWMDEYGMIKEDIFPSEWIGLSNLAVQTLTTTFREILALTGSVLCITMLIGHVVL